MTARLVWVLLRNELRLTWRGYPAAGRWFLLFMIGVYVVCAHIFAFLTAGLLAATGGSIPFAFEQRTWLVLSALVLGGGVVNATRVIVDREDADLLLTAPIPAGVVVATRWAAIAASNGLGVLFFGLPLVNAAVWFFGAAYLASYAVLFLLIAAAATFGLTLALVLIRGLGPRRGRVSAQVLGTFLTFGVVIVMQWARVAPAVPGFSAGFDAVSNNAVTSFLVRAGRSEPLALAFLASTVVLATVLVLRAFGRTLLRGYAEPETSRAIARGPLRPFDTPFDTRLGPAVLRKDARLVLRDPLLLSKVLPQTLIVVPILVSTSRHHTWVGLSGAAVFVVVQLTHVLAGVLASGEEGWDLILASPARARTVLFAKLRAAMILPGLVGLALFALVLWKLDAWTALYAGSLAATGSFSAAWFEVADIRPSPRADILKRQRPGDTARSMWVLFLGGLGSASAALAASGMWIAALVVLVPFLGACAGTIARRSLDRVNLGSLDR